MPTIFSFARPGSIPVPKEVPGTPPPPPPAGAREPDGPHRKTHPKPDLLREDDLSEEKWIYQFRSLAWAALGNAYRVQDDLLGDMGVSGPLARRP